MSDKLNGAEYKLAKIFSSDFEYHIPSYQRPYAWTTDETSELFDDLYSFYQSENEDEEYFLGSIVLIKERSKPYAEVIDGQQRLTTLTILLATLAYQLSGEERNTIYKYIVEPGNEFEGLDPKPRLTLRERDKEFFSKYVQNLDFHTLLSFDRANLKNESQANIQANSKHLLGCIDKSFAGDIAEIKSFVRFLLQRCFLVAVSTPNQQSAFRVFSVMNSRGLDLQPTDIIKADIIGKIPEKSQDDYNNRWEEMEIELGRAGFNDLFSFIRMIYAKEKAKKAIIDEFRHYVLSEIKDPQKLLEDVLEPYAAALATIKKANYQAAENAREVNVYLRWLNRIDNSDWIPTAIFFMAKNRDNPDYVRWFFKKLERLAAYLHVCAKNVNERIERYNEVISALEKNNSFDNPITEIDLTSKEVMEMKNTLNGNIYELTPRRRNYVILRLDAFMSDGAASYDPAILTIEHVLPQTVDVNSEWAELWPEEEKRAEWVHRISNLVPLNRRRNSQAQNYDFDKKKTAYFKGSKNVSSYALTTQVLNTPSWTEDFLIQRQEELLHVLSENWDLREAA
ncbi:MAG TPA: DUF262 domain-containing protein [Rhodospirillales bacterium]|nr:DUF262 domain-containing protein [Rhodospirillales bacterium]HIL76759.1 DUF262 domain-containing protein [Rhodospirillales bacterium]